MDYEAIKKKLGAGGKRAILRMTTDWQFCGKATFDASGAHNAWWRGKGAIERDLRKDGKWSRHAYRLNPTHGPQLQRILL